MIDLRTPANGQKTAAKYGAFEGKRYLRMLVTTAKC